MAFPSERQESDSFNSFLGMPQIFWWATIGVFLLCGFGAANPEGVFQAIEWANGWIFNTFGWFYLGFVSLTLVLFVAIGLSPLGNIRLGPEGEAPQYSTFSWVSMLFSAGMGTGLMFWGAAEPLYHAFHPPLDVVKSSIGPLTQGYLFSFFHWGLHPWSVYGMTTLAIAFMGYNLNCGVGFGAVVDGWKDSRWGRVLASRNVRWVIDLATLAAILAGVSATLAMGVLQLSGGLAHVFPKVFTNTPWTLALLLLASFVSYMTSSLLGLDKGIKWMSNVCVILSLALLGVVVVFTPAWDSGQELMGAFKTLFTHLPQLSFGLGPYEDPHWIREWTVKYWSWWIAWAPFVGIFVAAISRGRTVRQLMLGVLWVPSLFSWLWFGVFGQAAFYAHRHGQWAGEPFTMAHVNDVLFELLGFLQVHPVWVGIALFLVGLNFINSADSATYTMAYLSQNPTAQGNHQGESTDPPAHRVQWGWGALLALLAGILLLVGGIDIVQQITLITTLPFTALLALLFGVTVVQMVRFVRRT